MSETPALEPEEVQHSTVLAGLMTAADIITRKSASFDETYEEIEVTVNILGDIFCMKLSLTLDHHLIDWS